MVALRVPLLIGAVLLTAPGCAARRPPPAPHPPVTAVAPATATPASASSTDVPGLTPHVLAMARADGYRARVVDGQVQFCRVEIPVGTALRHRHCVTATALRWEVEQEQEQRRDLRQGSPSFCQGMGC